MYSFLSSKLYRFISIQGKMHKSSKYNWFMDNFPFLSNSKMWTDEEVYQEFGLTDEEIAHVEGNFREIKNQRLTAP